jgi:hypothetical protein
MGVLKDKSIQSLKSANALIKQNLYSSSIHCAYYSCIQLILDIFYEDLELTEEQLEEEFSDFKREKRYYDSGDESGRHNFYINKIIRELYDRAQCQEDDDQATEVMNFLNTIKKKRVDADYKRVLIGAKEGEKTEQRAKLILDVLSITDFKE